MRIQDWTVLPGRELGVSPQAATMGTRVVILAKEAELSSLGTAVVTRVPGEVVMMGDGLVGEAVGAQ